MKLQEAIDKRHSIREFEEKEVPKKILKKLVSNAAKAPSAKNEQNWKFYIVISKNKRDKLLKIINKKFLELKNQIEKLPLKIKRIAFDFYSNLGGCQNIIFVYRKARKNSPNYQFPNDISGISAAIENLMLSAVSEGLGTCWIGTFKGAEKEVSKILHVKNQELIASVLVGYPRKGYKPLKRKKKALNEVLRFK